MQRPGGSTAEMDPAGPFQASLQTSLIFVAVSRFLPALPLCFHYSEWLPFLLQGPGAPLVHQGRM